MKRNLFSFLGIPAAFYNFRFNLHVPSFRTPEYLYEFLAFLHFVTFTLAGHFLAYKYGVSNFPSPQ